MMDDGWSMMDDPQSMINDERMFVTGQGRVTGVAELPTQRDIPIQNEKLLSQYL